MACTHVLDETILDPMTSKFEPVTVTKRRRDVLCDFHFSAVISPAPGNDIFSS